MACDHLCQLGYDIAEVEEALEMFQNCETKVKYSESYNIVFNFISSNKTTLVFDRATCIAKQHCKKTLY